MHGEPTAAPPPTTTFNLLFVCTGNTCRSPLAELLARDLLARRGWSHAAVASAGVQAARAEPASPHAVAVALGRGLDLAAHRSQQLTPGLVGWADLVLVMGPAHRAAVERLGGGAKAALLGDFAAGGDGLGDAVPDPFGGPEEAYRATIAELERLIDAALHRLEPILDP